MARRFHLRGEDWEATSTGIGHSEMSGSRTAPIARWGVRFRRIGDPEYGAIQGVISRSDPDQATDEELRAVLEELLVIGAIEKSRYVWRTAEALSAETHVPVLDVRRILESSDEVMRSVRPNNEGLLLYTTRDHYQKGTPLLRRYFNIVAESS